MTEIALIPEQRQCPDCERATPRAHRDAPTAGFAVRCVDCEDALGRKILDRGKAKTCSCDRTVHDEGGPFCQREEQS